MADIVINAATTEVDDDDDDDAVGDFALFSVNLVNTNRTFRAFGRAVSDPSRPPSPFLRTSVAGFPFASNQPSWSDFAKLLQGNADLRQQQHQQHLQQQQFCASQDGPRVIIKGKDNLRLD